jgi:hypothetical protein
MTWDHEILPDGEASGDESPAWRIEIRRRRGKPACIAKYANRQIAQEVVEDLRRDWRLSQEGAKVRLVKAA